MVSYGHCGRWSAAVLLTWLPKAGASPSINSRKQRRNPSVLSLAPAGPSDSESNRAVGEGESCRIAIRVGPCPRCCHHQPAKISSLGSLLGSFVGEEGKSGGGPFRAIRKEKTCLVVSGEEAAMEMGSLDLFAREGRELQRYDEEHFRLVAGCIPYKLAEKVGHDEDLGRRLLVLMVSSPNKNNLIFPKGGWEKDESKEEAACREAFEEAGVQGNLRGVLGVWTFRSKSSESACSQVGFCKGSMFALEVTTELPSWPEKHCHERIWLTVDKAWEVCRYPWMREALTRCIELLSEEAALQVKPEGRCTELSENECLENPINALC